MYFLRVGEVLDMYIYIYTRMIWSVYIYIYIYMYVIYTWNPHDPCCDWKRPGLGGLTFKNRGQFAQIFSFLLDWQHLRTRLRYPKSFLATFEAVIHSSCAYPYGKPWLEYLLLLQQKECWANFFGGMVFMAEMVGYSTIWKEHLDICIVW